MRFPFNVSTSSEGRQTLALWLLSILIIITSIIRMKMTWSILYVELDDFQDQKVPGEASNWMVDRIINYQET